MSSYDDPNREAVGLDPAWVEGTGGSSEEVTPVEPSGPQTAEQLDGMTKDQLLAYAQQIGVTPANAGMTKEEIRAGIDAKQAGGA